MSVTRTLSLETKCQIVKANSSYLWYSKFAKIGYTNSINKECKRWQIIHKIVRLVTKMRTFNEPRSMSVGSSPMENIRRMIVERMSVSRAGRRGTVNTTADDTNIVVHRRPDSLGSRSAS